LATHCYKLTAGEGDIDAAMASSTRNQAAHGPPRLAPIAMSRAVYWRIIFRRRRIDRLVIHADPHLLRTQLA